ncbi:ATP-binding cassette domain-containing protein [Adlercreutzia aquisgranensis]|uniref:ATP-binding cassette domain-containing protein n=1 Tax=Adlercreutzia aquisgranensis TaxID=2941323 RepID=UPI00203D56A6|nr:ATP-binding cassette domain-containing protein [Adlercreutzia aquisgranensis]
MALVEVSAFRKVMRKRIVLDDVSCLFSAGRVYAIRGQNGSGKTMLLRAIAGLILPTSGFVTVDGLQVGKDVEFPQDMGLLIEEPAFIGTLTGFRNLELLASIRGRIGGEEIRESLMRCGLDPDDRRRFSQYSLGMKQRLGIACAIMEKPGLLLLDEPFNALDASGIAQTCEILDQERARGVTIIVATHDKYELELVQDCVLTMDKGRLIGYEEVMRGRPSGAPGEWEAIDTCSV